MVQVIALTEELLATAKQHENSGSNIEKTAGVSPGIPQYDWSEKVKQNFRWVLFGCSRETCFVFHSSFNGKFCVSS